MIYKGLGRQEKDVHVVKNGKGIKLTHMHVCQKYVTWTFDPMATKKRYWGSQICHHIQVWLGEGEDMAIVS